MVKKVGGGFLKIVHEKYRAKHAEDQEELHQRQMEGKKCLASYFFIYLSSYSHTFHILKCLCYLKIVQLLFIVHFCFNFFTSYFLLFGKILLYFDRHYLLFM